MKKIFWSSILFFVLMSMAVNAAISLTPATDNAEVNIGRNVTKYVTITNDAGSSVAVTLPPMTFPAEKTPGLPGTPGAVSVVYNTTSPVTVPGSNGTATIKYTVVVPQDAIVDTGYVGTLHFTADDTSTADFTFPLDIIGRLIIDDLSVEVEDSITGNDEDDDDLKDGDSIRAEARPGSTVVFEIALQNTYSRADDIDMEDVMIEMTIQDVDDGDDLEEESDEIDIDAGDEEDLEIEFEIPMEVDEDEYDVIIYVTGEDTEGNEYEFEWELILEVEKESHFIYISQAELSPSKVKCGDTATLDLQLMNLGENDEEEVELEIKNAELGLDIEEELIELDEDYDDDYTKDFLYNFDIGSGVDPGTYSIIIKSYYKPGKLSDTEAVDLIVERCSSTTTTTPTTTTPTTTTTTTTPTTSTTPSGTTTILNPPIITQPTSSSVEEESFTDKAGYVWTLIIVNVVGLGVLIFFIVKKFVLKH